MSFCQVPKLIRQHYLRTWFLVDFLSTVPFDKIVASAYDQNKIRTQLRSIRLIKSLRLFRLIKMVRVIKLGKITESIKGKPKLHLLHLLHLLDLLHLRVLHLLHLLHLLHFIHVHLSLFFASSNHACRKLTLLLCLIHSIYYV